MMELKQYMNNMKYGGKSMNNKHKDCKRQFTHLSRAWYGRVNLDNRSETVDEINIGFYHPEGSTTGEFYIRWYSLGNSNVPCLECYDDGWDALWNFKDMLEKLAEIDGTDITPLEMCELLVSLGIEDATEETDPSGTHDSHCRSCGQLIQK